MRVVFRDSNAANLRSKAGARGGKHPKAAAAPGRPHKRADSPARTAAPSPSTISAAKPKNSSPRMVLSKTPATRAPVDAASADESRQTAANEVAPSHPGGKVRMRSQISQEYESIAPYMRIAQTHPPLTREREYELSSLSRAGDQKARKLLVNHNIAFVLSMCRRYANKGCRLDDLVQEGMIGLLKAVEHFDPAKGNRFSTYASWWIRAYVQKYLRDMRATVKPIVSQPGHERFALPRDFSLDTPVGDDDDTTHLDRLEDVGPTQEDRFLRGEHSDEVRAALERVRKRIGGLGWDIVEQRLEEDQPRTLEEIGKEWGLSRERVRQVEKSTRSFLERYLESFAA